MKIWIWTDCVAGSRDTGGRKDVRLVFSFAASTAGVPFNPPTMHAESNLQQC